jgi:uncharacterized protein (TIGR00106 family)
MSVLLEFAMFPTDKGESVSNYVSRLVKVIRDSGIPHQLTPMGTIVETESMSQALALVHLCYDQLAPDCNRVYSSLKFDIRKGEPGRMAQKIASIESKIGKA